MVREGNINTHYRPHQLKFVVPSIFEQKLTGKFFLQLFY